MPARHAAFLILCIAAAPALAAQQGSEVEPNDAFADANVFRAGDTISAQLGDRRDVDYFAFDLQAGARFLFTFVEGRQGCSGVTIYAPNQTALIGRGCHAENTDTLRAIATTTGRYYVRLYNDDDLPGELELPPHPYKVTVWIYSPPPGGLGNPLARLAAMGDEITSMAAAPNGDLLVMHYHVNSSMQQISRVTPGGAISPFATGINTFESQIAVDALGDLLVPASDAGGNVVWRYNLKTGARTTFARPPAARYTYTGVTIGADGDVWLATPGGPDASTFVRFDPFGNLKSQVPVAVRTFFLTTAQNGELFFRAQQTGDVYRLANNTTPVRVISGASAGAVNVEADVALDQDGWVYLYNKAHGTLLLYNAQYQIARDPLAQVFDSAGWKIQHLMSGPSWMRDRNGKMTSRMVVTRGPGRGNEDEGTREILEVNHRGMGAPVARIIVVGDVSAGPIFTFKPSAGSQVSAYRVTIDQVASRADAVRASMTNYSLTISAAP